MRKRWIIACSLFAALGVGAIWGKHALRPRDNATVVAGPVAPLTAAINERIAKDAVALNTAAVIVGTGDSELLAWGDADEPLDIRSIRKSVLNLVLGRLVKEGRLELDASLEDLGIDDRDFALDAVERSASVRDLMEARSGVYHLAARETRSAAMYRPERGAHAPGEFWYYNNWDFNALETIAAQAAGDADYCDTFARYAAPVLEIAAPDTRCEVQLDDVSIHAAHAITMSARELADLARVFMQEAQSPDLLPEGWVAWSTEAVSDFHFIDDSRFNYGRLFWVIDPYAGVGELSYMMRGAGSIYVWVMPSENLFVVHQVRTSPLYLRNRLGLTPDDNDAWTFGGRIASALLRGRYEAEPLY